MLIHGWHRTSSHGTEPTKEAKKKPGTQQQKGTKRAHTGTRTEATSIDRGKYEWIKDDDLHPGIEATVPDRSSTQLPAQAYLVRGTPRKGGVDRETQRVSKARVACGWGHAKTST